MSKKTVFRYFFDFIDGQEKWLNSMAARGHRLKKCGKMTYTFDECKPNEYEYAVEFVGDKSYSKAKDYLRYLESMGFRTFTKNINLNFSYGKARWRPFAKGMGQIATSPGGFNKELLILEKKRDGKPFELHTDVSDKLNTYKKVKRTYAWDVLIMLLLGAMTFIPNISSMSATMTWVLRAILLIISVLFVIPMVKYSSLIKRLKEESKIFE
ncbi:hypothetical protein FHR92_003133 [Fontibacillus solani]|uniref:DUF2812 domain-containing protein n=1 Tax=Fontibacillus solani TaxID=1572857 RepID=A0A7W3SV19_9BACL|nr:DUF2812 domain-containing protein [Fontibacillus solani]MBA9086653.1 hypothetical protein [Fontibacillus solani]